MEPRYGTDPSNRHGTGVWNGGMERGMERVRPGPCSGPYNLTCIYNIYIYITSLLLSCIIILPYTEQNQEFGQVVD